MCLCFELGLLVRCIVSSISLNVVYNYDFAGIESAKLLVSTDANVTISDLDGTNYQPISSRSEVVQSTKESNGL